MVSNFFMVFGWFPWFCWLRTPQNYILAQRSSLGLVGRPWPTSLHKSLWACNLTESFTLSWLGKGLTLQNNNAPTEVTLYICFSSFSHLDDQNIPWRLLSDVVSSWCQLSVQRYNRMNTILPIYSDCTIGERRKLYNATTAVIRLCTFSAPTWIENWRNTGGAEELHLRPVFADQ